MGLMTRRESLKLAAAAGIAAWIPIPLLGAELQSLPGAGATGDGKEAEADMKLGLVTYNIAGKWDLPTLIEKCVSVGIEGVELRTTHAHGVEPSLGKSQRREVRKRFEDSGIVLWGLGSVCEFHQTDPAVVKKNVEDCRAFTLLAVDVGAKGVKVRPNGFPEGVSREKTLEQIGLALRECGRFAADHGVEIWLEVHGKDTCHPPHIRAILDHCDHRSVGACWNSNAADIKDGSVSEYFELLRPDIKSCHINQIWTPSYPWRELFRLLKASKYDRFTLAEIPESADPDAVLRYYRALWAELTG